MYRVVSVVILSALLMGSVGAMAVDSPQEVAAQQRTSFWCRILPWMCVEPGPTPTPEPTATATPEPTATTVPPTNTPDPTATSEPGACSVPEGADVWHEPTTHEHGDAPPAWADDWSCEQFGHPVIFGGDEQTPNENTMKHEAYKGYAFTTRADNRRYVDIYVRLHMQSNPHGRSAQYHSYEMYVRDNQGNVSFWQGWLDFGPAPEHRDTHSDGHARDIIPMYDPANHIIGWDADGNTHWSDSYADFGTGREFWYAQQSTPGGWEPVFLIDIYDPSTYMLDGEHIDPMNQSAWQATGDYGLDRRVRFRWIVNGATTNTVSGQPYLQRNTLNPRGWFCATPQGDVTALGVSGPDGCGDALPQHIAPSMPTIGDTSSSQSVYRNQWGCPDCTLPN